MVILQYPRVILFAVDPGILNVLVTWGKTGVFSLSGDDYSKGRMQCTPAEARRAMERVEKELQLPANEAVAQHRIIKTLRAAARRLVRLFCPIFCLVE